MLHEYSLGFSPCPNDTFIFDALVHQRFQSPLKVIPHLYDVEQLNEKAHKHELDITKLSFNAYAFVSEHYQILQAGSALGRNCGPLLICKRKFDFNEINNLRIAIPGKYTTANLLLSIFAPQAKHKTEMIFSHIEDAVLSGDFDAGLIIHENRFTYQQKGLLKIADMGELWEENFHSAIPLGCIAVRRGLPEIEKKIIEEAIFESVSYAFENPHASRQYVQQHSQELSEEVQQQHIRLYVNDFSIDLGKEGQEAIRKLFTEGQKAGLLPPLTEPVFL
jgi:1,4-dihydroxy-6-naphthoate synthase